MADTAIHSIVQNNSYNNMLTHDSYLLSYLQNKTGTTQYQNKKSLKAQKQYLTWLLFTIILTKYWDILSQIEIKTKIMKLYTSKTVTTDINRRKQG